jgi:uncharacterized NAD(P)/FAD-binding protein YdhS
MSSLSASKLKPTPGAPPDRTVAIIGGGFTGAACAVHMVRAAKRPLAIEIVEPRDKVGGGVAYGAAAHEHRINVPSDRMTVFSETPTHFSQWLDRHGLRDADPQGWTEEGHFYSRRQAFGDYMADLVAETGRSNASGSTVTHLCGRAADIVRGPRGIVVTVEPAAGARSYDAAVIAASHATPAFKWSLLNGAGSPSRSTPKHVRFQLTALLIHWCASPGRWRADGLAKLWACLKFPSTPSS